MSKRVYKFTVAEHGISNLENKRLKLSTIGDLNDPFDDFAAIDTTDPQIEHAVRMSGAQLKSEIGLLCFSRNWDNLLLWSHYGRSHTGICLGFDISEGEPGANYDTRGLLSAESSPNPLPRGCEPRPRISPPAHQARELELRTRGADNRES